MTQQISATVFRSNEEQKYWLNGSRWGYFKEGSAHTGGVIQKFDGLVIPMSKLITGKEERLPYFRIGGSGIPTTEVIKWVEPGVMTGLKLMTSSGGILPMTWKFSLPDGYRTIEAEHGVYTCLRPIFSGNDPVTRSEYMQAVIRYGDLENTYKWSGQSVHLTRTKKGFFDKELLNHEIFTASGAVPEDPQAAIMFLAVALHDFCTARR